MISYSTVKYTFTCVYTCFTNGCKKKVFRSTGACGERVCQKMNQECRGNSQPQ